MKTSLPLWIARIGLPLVIIPALLFALQILREGRLPLALGITGMQALFIFWAVKAWAK